MIHTLVILVILIFAYTAAIAGGIPKFVPLRPTSSPSTSSSQWKLDINELKAAITPKTKMILVNTPQNIPGKIYSMEELTAIADLAKKHNLLVISDEVYEAMTYDGEVQNRIATLPGMFERTLTIGSAGKTFSVTGWKIGWVIAPKDLATALYVNTLKITDS
jgi:aspartate/methionine/tyrosine aminotransferase